jgi:hypothetical protein
MSYLYNQFGLFILCLSALGIALYFLFKKRVGDFKNSRLLTAVFSMAILLLCLVLLLYVSAFIFDILSVDKPDYSRVSQLFVQISFFVVWLSSFAFLQHRYRELRTKIIITLGLLSICSFFILVSIVVDEVSWRSHRVSCEGKPMFDHGHHPDFWRNLFGVPSRSREGCT